MLTGRLSGLLLHITSLPSPYGIGDLGDEAYRFVDFLKQARQGYWQVLPLNPPQLDGSRSPYDSSSAFAGSPLMISPVGLHRHGLLTSRQLEDVPTMPVGPADHGKAWELRQRPLELAWEAFRAGGPHEQFEQFCRDQAYWLDDYSLFAAWRSRLGDVPWNDWPPPARDRHGDAVDDDLRARQGFQKFIQYEFARQWRALRDYCRHQGVQVIGDMAYYVSYDSADVWSRPGLFKLDHDRKPAMISGVPPDAFSDTGQLWGNPVYDWDAHEAQDFSWWLERLERNFELFDLVRIDHFRGFLAYWEVPAGSENAIAGQWVQAPAKELFGELYRRRSQPPIIVEDLGLITPDVREFVEHHRLPAMKVLQFSLDGPAGRNPYLLHEHTPNALVYTGTHDNNTTRAWLESEATPLQKHRLRAYLGHRPRGATISWDLIRLAMMSPCAAAIIPVQDVLNLGSESRMNQPSRELGNWTWRMAPGSLKARHARRLALLGELTGRA